MGSGFISYETTSSLQLTDTYKPEASDNLAYFPETKFQLLVNDLLNVFASSPAQNEQRQLREYHDNDQTEEQKEKEGSYPFKDPGHIFFPYTADHEKV